MSAPQRKSEWSLDRALPVDTLGQELSLDSSVDAEVIDQPRWARQRSAKRLQPATSSSGPPAWDPPAAAPIQQPEKPSAASSGGVLLASLADALQPAYRRAPAIVAVEDFERRFGRTDATAKRLLELMGNSTRAADQVVRETFRDSMIAVGRTRYVDHEPHDPFSFLPAGHPRPESPPARVLPWDVRESFWRARCDWSDCDSLIVTEAAYELSVQKYWAKATAAGRLRRFILRADIDSDSDDDEVFQRVRNRDEEGEAAEERAKVVEEQVKLRLVARAGLIYDLYYYYAAFGCVDEASSMNGVPLAAFLSAPPAAPSFQPGARDA